MATSKTVRRWEDLDLDFISHPTTNDIVKKVDNDAIRRSVKNLLTIDNYEKPFHPEIGSGITNLLFEPLSSVTSEILQNSIEETIRNFEPRVTVVEVDVQPQPNQNGYDVRLQMYINNQLEPIIQEIFLEVLR